MMSIPIEQFTTAVALTCPGAAFAVNPEKDGYGALKMMDGTPKPTEAKIEAAWAARIPPAPDPTDRQLILWLMKGLSKKDQETAFKEAASM